MVTLEGSSIPEDLIIQNILPWMTVKPHSFCISLIVCPLCFFFLIRRHENSPLIFEPGHWERSMESISRLYNQNATGYFMVASLTPSGMAKVLTWKLSPVVRSPSLSYFSEKALKRSTYLPLCLSDREDPCFARHCTRQKLLVPLM